MEHEQDTVLQLQEVIEQLRNVFPSEPGQEEPPRENRGQRGEQKGTAAGGWVGRGEQMKQKGGADRDSVAVE